MEVHQWQDGLHSNIAVYSSISTPPPRSLLKSMGANQHLRGQLVMSGFG